MVRHITNDEVRECLDMRDAVDVLEHAYRAEAAGRAVNIPRSDMILPLGTDEAYVYKVMPGAVEDLSVAAIRLQSDRIRWSEGRKVKIGAARDGKYVQHVLVYDTETCEPILSMPDGFTSKMRVGATNALGAKYMAPRDAETVGLLGAGRQAGGQVWGFDTVLDLEEVRVFSPTQENRETFAAEWDDRLDTSIVAVDNPTAAVGGADVFACATNAMNPVFDPDMIEKGQHVSAIKIPEVPAEAFEHVDRLAVHSHTPVYGPDNYAPRGSNFDQRLDDAWKFEGVDLLEAPELADLVAGEPSQKNDDETTFFLNNTGTGIQWAACGRHIYEKAEAQRLGEEVDTDWFVQSVW